MQIQDVFYFLASIFMLAGIFILVLFGIILWRIYQAIGEAKKNIVMVREEIIDRAAAMMQQSKTKMLSAAGASFASFLVGQVRNVLRRRNASNSSSE